MFETKLAVGSTVSAVPTDCQRQQQQQQQQQHQQSPVRTKLHGRAFYESIGSPKYILAPMVDQSEFAWRMLTRSFLPESQRSSLLAYSPMLHARLFAESQGYRDSHFQPIKPPSSSSEKNTTPTTAPATTPWLDGNPSLDRPLFVQFCANEPAFLLAAAQQVAPHCDAVDLNLGCPQGIARKGYYGAFLQEDQELIHRLIQTLHESLPVPVTAKIRILETEEATLAYARKVLDAGASILTVHGRRREQKGHLTGTADWGMIRYLRNHLPPETVLFANGNVLQHGDLERCLEATGADGVMSAEGNLSDPGIFAPPPPEGAAAEQEGNGDNREYWTGLDGEPGGWRVEAVVRRYLDILHRYVEGREPPVRRPLFLPGDDEAWLKELAAPEKAEGSSNKQPQDSSGDGDGDGDGEPARKKRRRNNNNNNNGDAPRDGTGIGKKDKCPSPNYIAVKAHLFHLLRHLITRHTDVRDALARSRMGPGHLAYLERVLAMIEARVAEGLLEYRRTGGRSHRAEAEAAEAKLMSRVGGGDGDDDDHDDDAEGSVRTVRSCRRPWWVVQPIVRPLPREAAAKGAVTMKAATEQQAKSDRKTKAAGGAGKVEEALKSTTDYPRSELVAGRGGGC